MYWQPKANYWLVKEVNKEAPSGFRTLVRHASDTSNPGKRKRVRAVGKKAKMQREDPEAEGNEDGQEDTL
jgi:hypothetical protein